MSDFEQTMKLGEATANLIEVARLIGRRFEEGSLQGDPDYESAERPGGPIQHQLRRALAALDEAA